VASFTQKRPLFQAACVHETDFTDYRLQFAGLFRAANQTPPPNYSARSQPNTFDN